MFRRFAYLALAFAFVLTGCDQAEQPLSPEAQASAQGGVQASTTGGGTYSLLGGAVPVEFSHTAIQTSSDGTATGHARHVAEFQGERLEFHTRVTCATFDPQNGRAWIGGVITQNNSTHPFWQTDNNEVGDAIWWRVVDYGEGQNAQADRSTFVGFEGNAGIITSREYCDAQIWPAGDARTGPLTEGEIQVRVR